MMTVDWIAGLLAAAVVLIFALVQAGGRWRRRRATPGLSYLGTVSQHWLTSHRAEH
jgi:hypothetical protein